MGRNLITLAAVLLFAAPLGAQDFGVKTIDSSQAPQAAPPEARAAPDAPRASHCKVEPYGLDPNITIDAFRCGNDGEEGTIDAPRFDSDRGVTADGDTTITTSWTFRHGRAVYATRFVNSASKIDRAGSLEVGDKYIKLLVGTTQVWGADPVVERMRALGPYELVHDDRFACGNVDWCEARDILFVRRFPPAPNGEHAHFSLPDFYLHFRFLVDVRHNLKVSLEEASQENDWFNSLVLHD